MLILAFFSEAFNEDVLREEGIDIHFVQDNHSLSVNRGWFAVSTSKFRRLLKQSCCG